MKEWIPTRLQPPDATFVQPYATGGPLRRQYARWTRHEDAALERMMVSGHGDKFISSRLYRTEASVTSRAHILKWGEGHASVDNK